MRFMLPAAVLVLGLSVSSVALADGANTQGANGPAPNVADRGLLNPGATPPALNVAATPQLINGGSTERVADLSIMSNSITN